MLSKHSVKAQLLLFIPHFLSEAVVWVADWHVLFLILFSSYLFYPAEKALTFLLSEEESLSAAAHINLRGWK